MALSEIVSVEVTINDRTPSEFGFGIPLIIDAAYNGGVRVFGPELVRSYSRVDAMIDDGFDPSSAAVRMAQAMFAQSPSVTSIKIGRRTDSTLEPGAADNSPQFALSATVLTAIEGYEFVVEAFGDGSKSVSHTVTAGQSANDVAAALVTLLTTAPVIPGLNITAPGAGVMQFDAAAEGNTYGVSVKVYNTSGALQVTQNHVTIANNTANNDIVGAYNAIRAEDDGFYCVLTTTQGVSERNALAAHIESQENKIFVCTDSTTTAAPLATYNRTAYLYHANPYEYADAAWSGRMLPLAPGSATWAFKELATINPDTTGAIPNGNRYTVVAGSAITRDGKMGSGRYIDLQNGIDWLVTRMQERIYAVLISANKVPYTDAGIAIVEAEVRAQLQSAVEQGVLAASPAFTVLVPKAADVSATNKANRILPDVFFSGVLAGAIQRIEIQGVVRV